MILQPSKYCFQRIFKISNSPGYGQFHRIILIRHGISLSPSTFLFGTNFREISSGSISFNSFTCRYISSLGLYSSVYNLSSASFSVLGGLCIIVYYFIIQ